jgi:glucokinase
MGSTGTAAHSGAPTLTVGVDIGGTKVAAGVVEPGGRVVELVRARTPSRSTRADVVEDIITGVVSELAARHAVEAVGIGAAGFVDAARSSILFSPHLSWRNEPLRDKLQRRLGLPVVVENDANAAAWGEYRFGSARGEDHVVVVNLGTGIGGAIVVDGVIQRGKHGVAGEFGHMQVVPQGRPCECGNRGCWEQYVSGNALVRAARARAETAPPVLFEAVNGDISVVTGPMLTQAALAGDAWTAELFVELGGWLGMGLANLAAALDPGLFVIGGGVSEAGELLLAPVRDAFRGHLTGRGFRPEARVVHAALGNEAGVIGAADLARAALKAPRAGLAGG